MKDKKTSKKKIFVSALVFGVLGGLLFGLIKPVDVNAWGPERDVYTNANPAPQAVFNSIKDNAAVGDERDFVRIVEIRDDGQKDAYKNDIKIRGGHDYEVYIYYHNNASATYNTAEYGYKGVARNVRVSAGFPESLKAGERGQVDAIISAERTLVEKVWDEAYITAEQDVTLAYISGSAKIFNLGKASGSILSTSLFSDEGVAIGYNTLNGVIYGCDEYSGQIVFQIRATEVVKPTSTFEMEKKISIDGGKSWAENAVVEPGSEAEFKITYRNTGNVPQTVTVFDTLENGMGMEYVPGSTRIIANGTETIVTDESGGALFNGGVNVGEIAPGETAEIYYKVKIKAIDTFVCGRTVMYNLASVTSKVKTEEGEESGSATQYDKVKIEVVRDDEECVPPEIPKTGPAEIVLAIVIVGGLIAGIIYYVNSKKALRKLEAKAKGETEDKIKEKEDKDK